MSEDFAVSTIQEVEALFRRQDVLEQENQQLTQFHDWLLPMLANGQFTVA
jgi:type I restriction enzyme S subunit